MPYVQFRTHAASLHSAAPTATVTGIRPCLRAQGSVQKIVLRVGRVPYPVVANELHNSSVFSPVQRVVRVIGVTLVVDVAVFSETLIWAMRLEREFSQFGPVAGLWVLTDDHGSTWTV